MPPKAAGKPKRKRQRKARTAAALDSDSASSSSESSSSESESKSESSSDSDSSSSSSGSSSSSSSSNSESSGINARRDARGNGQPCGFRITPEPDSDTDSSDEEPPSFKIQDLAPPSLPSHLTSIIDHKTSTASERALAKQQLKQRLIEQRNAEKEKMKEAFRGLWMKSIVEEFGDELDAIRNREPTLGADGGTRLPLFIDALGAGSELFSSAAQVSTAETRSGAKQIDEVALAMDLS